MVASSIGTLPSVETAETRSCPLSIKFVSGIVCSLNLFCIIYANPTELINKIYSDFTKMVYMLKKMKEKVVFLKTMWYTFSNLGFFVRY